MSNAPAIWTPSKTIHRPTLREIERVGRREPFSNWKCPPFAKNLPQHAAITVDQAWVYNLTFGAATLVLTLGANPVANSYAVICALVGDTTLTLSISADTFGDSGGGSWVNHTGPNSDTTLTQRTYIFGRQIGTGPTGKTATIAASSGTPHIGGYLQTIKGHNTSSQPDVVATAKVIQTGANPALAAYTAAAGAYIVGYFSSDSAAATAGAGGGGFTVRKATTDWNNDYVEDQIWPTGGSLVTNLVDAASAHWCGQGVSFKAAASGITYPQLERFHRGEFRGEHG